MESFRTLCLAFFLVLSFSAASTAETPESCNRSVDAYLLDRLAWSGDLFGVQLLLERGTDPNGAPESEIIRCFAGRPVSPPLMQAASQGHVEILKLLLKSGADPNVWCCDSSAVQAAAASGHSEVVRLLLAAGAEPSGVAAAAREGGHTVLAEEIESIK
jgi:ankyrin repeat protein